MQTHRSIVGRTNAPCPGDAPVLVSHTGQVSAQQHQQLLRQRAVTVWFTGLSGAGKSTLSYALEKQLHALGFACFVLDGDNLRQRLNRDLGFSPADRTENIRRVAEVAALMNDAGLIVCTALISPYREDRAMARSIIGSTRFIEVHVSTSLQVCEERDPKGLYDKARAGSIPHFTGISAPYEEPQQPGLCIDTARYRSDEASLQLLGLLQQQGFIR